jgi:hypothetical protein
MGYFLLAFVLMCGVASADFIVITDKDGGVYTVSEKDDTAVPAGYVKTIVEGKMSEVVPASRPIDEYKFSGKKFKVDADAVKEKEDNQLLEDQKKAAKKNKKQSAKDKLKVLGLDDAEIEAITGE